MKKIVLIIICLFLKMGIGNCQTWKNNISIYLVSKLDSSFIPDVGIDNYCSIIDSKVYVWGFNSFHIYDNLNFENHLRKQPLYYARFLYKASNDTLYGLRIQVYEPFRKEFFYFSDSTFDNDTNTDIITNFNKIWMGNYYIKVKLKDTINTIQILNRQNQLLSTKAYQFENNNWVNKWFHLFLATNYPTYQDSSDWPNYKIQYLTENTIVFSYALADSLGNLPTLYSYKISYENEVFDIRMVAKFENFPLVVSSTYPYRFIFNDITFTQNLDTMVISVINNRTDSIHLPIGNIGYTIPPTTKGHYVFTLNKPDGVFDREVKKEFVINPNPNNGYFTIRNKKEKIVFDCLGKEILRTFDEDIYLPKGFYFVRVGAEVAKVIVE